MNLSRIEIAALQELGRGRNCASPSFFLCEGMEEGQLPPQDCVNWLYPVETAGAGRSSAYCYVGTNELLIKIHSFTLPGCLSFSI
eukprot:gene8967-6290_t